MSAHTPGPWQAIIPSKRQKTDVTAMVATTAGPGSMAIDCTKSGTTRDEDAANARLIAAAPELLAALKDCFAYCERDMDGDEDSTLLKMASAAIAKAEGKS
jgi:hypothetical protein